MTTARWLTIGKYRVLATPLPTNPAFITHRIFLGNECIGRQLSVPSEADCDSRLYEYRHPQRDPCSRFKPYTAWKGGAPRNGRPRRDPYAEMEQEDEALQA